MRPLTTIGRLAREHHATAVLVAGDVYEHDGVGDLSLDQPLERMRTFPGIAWHLIPGNHDCDRPSGVWDRLCRRELPANIHVHRRSEPVPLGDGKAWLLPAPLQRKRSLSDLTAFMDEAQTPEGAIRIGLAHGSVRDFGSTPGQTANRIAPGRPETARLDYLALGDWHSAAKIGPRCWYSGTPEPDDFDQPASGAALLVDLAGPGALPSVTSLATGCFRWHCEQVVIHGADDIDLLEECLRARQPDPARLLVRLEVDGTLSLADGLRFDQQIGQRLRAALRSLELRDRLLVAPRAEDLDAIASGGILRAAVERLSDLVAGAAGDEREVAQMALLRLCVEHARTPVMKLRALELDQFKKFDRPVRVEGFEDGLNLLCGPNEMGKSTIMAALHAVLFERHRAAGEHIKALQPWGHKTAPSVALDFELDGQLYHIEKRFLRNEHAPLRLPDGRRFEGPEAEEEVQRLLGFAEPGNRGITPEQLGAWSMLWVGQGHSFAQPEIADRARRSIEGCLAAETGALLGTEESSEIRKAVQQAHGELIGAYGRPKGRNKEVIEEIEALTEERDRLRQAKLRLAGEVEQLEAARRRLEELRDEREDQRLLGQRDEAQRRCHELKALQDQIRTAEAQHGLAVREHERQREEIERRARLAARIEELKARVAAAAAEAASAGEALARSDAEIERLQLRRSELEERRSAVAQAQARLRRLQGFAHLLETLRHLGEQQRTVQVAVGQAEALRLRAEAIRLDEIQVEELRSASREHERAGAALRAVATRIRFAIDGPALDRVRLDGMPLAEPKSERQVVKPATIAIARIGTITVAPQIEGRGALLANLDDAARRLRDLLAAAGVERVEVAEARLREKQGLERDAEVAEHRARSTACAALPGVDGPEALRIEIERRLGAVESERAVLEIDDAPDRNTVECQLSSVETEVVGLDQGLREVAGLLEGARDGREQHLSAHGRAGEAARQAQVDLQGFVAELDLAERERPALAVERALAEAASELEDRRRALAELQARAAGANLELVEIERTRVERAIERRRDDVGDLREKVAALQSGIDRDEGAGLEERIEDVIRRLGLRERERLACEREVQALRLLGETLDEAERAAKERYLQPVVDRFRPYLWGLFPEADLRVDDSFRITAVRRGAAGEEPFEQLSDGTREQIAVLARLAFAEMLADRGLPVVVVLDDALAFSDDRRLEQMFNILHHAAQRLQIIVFTCRERLFENLGATRLRLVDAERSAAAAD